MTPEITVVIAVSAGALLAVLAVLFACALNDARVQANEITTLEASEKSANVVIAHRNMRIEVLLAEIKDLKAERNEAVAMVSGHRTTIDALTHGTLKRDIQIEKLAEDRTTFFEGRDDAIKARDAFAEMLDKRDVNIESLEKDLAAEVEAHADQTFRIEDLEGNFRRAKNEADAHSKHAAELLVRVASLAEELDAKDASTADALARAHAHAAVAPYIKGQEANAARIAELEDDQRAHNDIAARGFGAAAERQSKLEAQVEELLIERDAAHGQLSEEEALRDLAERNVTDHQTTIEKITAKLDAEVEAHAAARADQLRADSERGLSMKLAEAKSRIDTCYASLTEVIRRLRPSTKGDNS